MVLDQNKEGECSSLRGEADILETIEEQESQAMRKEIDEYYAWLDEGTTTLQEDLSGDMMISDDEEGRVENQETSSTVVSNVVGGSSIQKASSTKKGSKGKDPSGG